MNEPYREDRQAAVRLLDQRGGGAFRLGKLVETVDEMMGVSRITLYNYHRRRPLGELNNDYR